MFSMIIHFPSARISENLHRTECTIENFERFKGKAKKMYFKKVKGEILL